MLPSSGGFSLPDSSKRLLDRGPFGLGELAELLANLEHGLGVDPDTPQRELVAEAHQRVGVAVERLDDHSELLGRGEHLVVFDVVKVRGAKRRLLAEASPAPALSRPKVCDLGSNDIGLSP